MVAVSDKSLLRRVHSCMLIRCFASDGGLMGFIAYSRDSNEMTIVRSFIFRILIGFASHLFPTAICDSQVL